MNNAGGSSALEVIHDNNLKAPFIRSSAVT